VLPSHPTLLPAWYLGALLPARVLSWLAMLGLLVGRSLESERRARALSTDPAR
jgi:hypothetical protein